MRALSGVAMLVCSVFAPLPLAVRVLALGIGGSYMLGTALAGSCLGYKLMGFSTCPIEQKEKLT